MRGLVHAHDHGSGSRLAAMEGNHFWFAGRDLLVRRLLRRHDTDPESPLLDLGSGTGRFARDLAASGRAVIAVDLAPGAEGPTGATFAARGEQLPLRDGSVGVVLARDVLEHVDDVAALAECARVLRPGGILVVLVPAWPALWSDRDVRAGHLRRYGRAEVRSKVDTAGLDVLEQRGYQLALLPALAATRLASRVGGPSVVDRVESPPAWLNALLTRVNTWEADLARRSRPRPPTGSSYALVARRPR